MITVKNKKSFLLYAGILLAVMVMVNIISRNMYLRLDFTDNKMYSLSESSKLVIDKVDNLLVMKVFFSENLPGEYSNNRRYLQDIIEEYVAISDGEIRFEIYLPDDNKKLEEEAQKYGIQPVQLQVIENDKLEIKKVYMGMVFIYEDEREIIPVIQTTTGLEYEITSKIKKLIGGKKRSVGMATLSDIGVENKNITELIRQSYDIIPIDLLVEADGAVDVILVNGVEDSLDTNVIQNLKDFVNRGGNLFIAQNRVKTDLKTQSATVMNSNIYSFLEEYNLYLAPNLVLDQVCAQVTVSQNRGFFRMNSAVTYPFFPMVREFGDHVTVEGLEQIRLIFPSEISFGSDSVNTEALSMTTPLLYTSDQSTSVEEFFNLTPIDNPAFNSLNEPGKVIAALSTIELDHSDAISEILLVSDSQFFSDTGGGSIQENFIFILNAVDCLLGESDLIELRSREITTRPLEELEDSTKSRWKWINFLLPSLLVVILGLIQWKRNLNHTRILEEMYEQK